MTLCRYNASLEALQPQGGEGWQCTLADGKVVQAQRIVGDQQPLHSPLSSGNYSWSTVLLFQKHECVMNVSENLSVLGVG